MRKVKTQLTLQVRVEVPKGSNAAEVMGYIRVAISSYGGGLDPENPFFSWGKEDVTVSLLKKETTYG